MKPDPLEFARILPEPTVILTADGEILAANPAFADCTNRPPDALRGQSVFHFIRSEEFGNYLKLASGSSALRMGRIAVWKGTETAEYRSECGVIRPASAQKAAVLLLRLKPQAHAITQFEALNRQVRNLQAEIARRAAAEEEVLRLNEQLEQKVRQRTAELEGSNQELRAFAYTIAHDLRAPLRSLKSFSSIVLEDYGRVLDAEGTELLQRISNAAQHMDDLLEDLLVYSNVNLFMAEVSPVSLDEIIGKIIDLLAEQIQTRGAEIAVEGTLGVVMGHPVLLRHLIMNLVSNAMKFVEDGTLARVKISAERENECTKVWVSDNGIGIAEEYVERIFGLFERLHTKEKYEGTGIGLAIAKRSVEKMGGQIGVVPNEPRGSRFWVLLRSASG